MKCGNVPVISNLQKTAITVWINVAGKGNSGQVLPFHLLKEVRKGCRMGIRIADFDKDGCKIQYSRQYVGDYGAWVCSTKVELNKWYSWQSLMMPRNLKHPYSTLMANCSLLRGFIGPREILRRQCR